MFGKMIGNIAGMTIDNYDDRKINRVNPEDNNGIGVSTIYAFDIEKFETALLDANGAHPIERYKKEEDSVLGHQKWVKFAKIANNKKIIRLGIKCEDIDIKNEEIILEKIK